MAFMDFLTWNSKSFLSYGMKHKLKGFYLYEKYFESEQIEQNHITRLHCLFSPRSSLCGHPSIQHGGASATIVDNNCGMLAMMLSREVAATAGLTIKYKLPIKEGQLYALCAEVQEWKGRDIYVDVVIEDIVSKKIVLEGQVHMKTVQWKNAMTTVFNQLFPK